MSCFCLKLFKITTIQYTKKKDCPTVLDKGYSIKQWTWGIGSCPAKSTIWEQGPNRFEIWVMGPFNCFIVRVMS